jgi:hypothetical protein
MGSSLTEKLKQKVHCADCFWTGTMGDVYHDGTCPGCCVSTDIVPGPPPKRRRKKDGSKKDTTI